MAFAHHVTMQLTGTDQLARSDGERCSLARLVLRTGDNFGLLWWRTTGPYVHLVCLGSRRRAGELARRVGIGAQQTLGGEHRFAPARCRAIELRRDLPDLFDKILGSLDSVDGAPGSEDPVDRFHVGSALPDLLGLRRTGAYLVPRVRRWVPGMRGRLEDLLGPHLFASHITDWSPLEAATAAAFGHVDLSRRWPWRPRALGAAAELAVPLMGTTATAELLGVSASAVRRARRRPVSPTLVQAVQRQLQWRQTGARTGPTLACGGVLPGS